MDKLILESVLLAHGGKVVKLGLDTESEQNLIIEKGTLHDDTNVKTDSRLSW